MIAISYVSPPEFDDKFECIIDTKENLLMFGNIGISNIPDCSTP